MQVLRSARAMARLAASWKGKVAFVPTMGALHEGHLSLVRLARRKAGRAGTVVVSIFVNPLQFGPKEDFSRYPRPVSRDLRLCREAGADVVFLPTVAAMYGPDRSVFVDEESLSLGLCGGARPGHFRGVCTVVAKLFNLVRPHFAIFGRKDAQQLAVIRRMVRDLDFPLAVVPAPTHREADGLAMSSRNAYLQPDERAQAPTLHRALLAGAAAVRRGERDPAAVSAAITALLAADAPLGRLDYAEVVDPVSLAPLERIEKHALLLVAVFFGRTRLIDNEEVAAPAEKRARTRQASKG